MAALRASALALGDPICTRLCLVHIVYPEEASVFVGDSKSPGNLDVAGPPHDDTGGGAPCNR